MSVLTIHIDQGKLRAVKADDIVLARIEVVAIEDGKPVASLRPSIEREIIRYVGEARENTALQMAIRALEEFAGRHLEVRAFSTFDEIEAAWEAAKVDTERRFDAARRLIYGGHGVRSGHELLDAAE